MQRLSTSAVAVSQFVASKALGVGQDLLRITALFFLMLYILFFFLRDGTQLVATMIRVLPLGDVRERQLLDKFSEVSLATIKRRLARAETRLRASAHEHPAIAEWLEEAR